MCATLPFSSITKVVRAIPMYLRTYMLFSFHTQDCRLREMKKGMLIRASLGLALAVGLPLTAADGDAKKGEAAFDNCAVCHNADSTETKIGPGLKGLFKREKLVNGKPVNEAN